MLRFISFLLVVFLMFSSTTQASLITSDNYISYDGDGDGVVDYDIIWASSNAFQFFGCNGQIANPENYLSTVYGTNPGENIVCANQLLTPEYAQDGWMFVEQVSGLSLGIISALYNDGSFQKNGVYVNGFEFWNTQNGAIISVNPYENDVISNWTSLDPLGIDPFIAGDQYFTNVFYARESQPVPEPATLLIFALGLIGLGLRKSAL